MVPTILSLSSSSRSAGIQYSRIVAPPTCWTSNCSRKSRHTSNLVTYPAPEAGTFQSLAIRTA